MSNMDINLLKKYIKAEVIKELYKNTGKIDDKFNTSYDPYDRSYNENYNKIIIRSNPLGVTINLKDDNEIDIHELESNINTTIESILFEYILPDIEAKYNSYILDVPYFIINISESKINVEIDYELHEVRVKMDYTLLQN